MMHEKYSIRAFLALAFFIYPVACAATARPVPSAADTGLADQDWYSRARVNIEASEYFIRPTQTAGAYQSPNRTQNLRFTYYSDGFLMKPRVDSMGDWRIEMRLLSISKGGPALVPSAEKDISKHLNNDSLTVMHEGFDVQYINREDGMRQNFIVREQPVGGSLLTITLSLRTSLSVIKKGAGDVLFAERNEKLGNFQNRVWYKDLKAWDARGTHLCASMNIKDDKLCLVINDDCALYPITVDPLSTTADWTMEGNRAATSFGTVVSSAGDVNGDGYSDIIVGVPYYDLGLGDEGRVYVYYGSESGLSTTASWMVESDQTTAFFGAGVSSAGDVNGDGYSDVIVGVPKYDNGQSDEGRAYVYYGSASGLSATASWTAESNQAGAGLGNSVACAGDVNGDGYSDIIVGASGYSNGQTNEGRAYVVHGSASGLNATASWIVESNQAEARFGASVSSAGDVNGDGYSDVIVGAPYFDNGETNEGRAFVFHGSASGLNTTASWTAESNQAEARFGASVSSAGNVNGDGYSDVIVGAPYFDNGETNEGRAFVFHGSASGLNTTASWTAESNQADASFGHSVSCVGDVNGDGYSDVIVGAPYFDNGEINEGKAYVFHGSASGLDSTASWTAESDQANARFGTSVSSTGDVNGDGYSDIIVGAPDYDNGETDEGKAFVYHGGAGGLNTATFSSVESNQANAGLGVCVSGAGDVNGDGYADVIAGAIYYDNGQTDEGRAFVYLGSAGGLNTTASWTAESNQANARFGTSVACAGDVNGDGYSDVIVGAYHYDNGETDEGRVYVYHGGAGGLSAAANWAAESNEAASLFGNSVACAGDVNGDGYSDIIVGAVFSKHSAYFGGGVAVYYGSAGGLSTAADWTVGSLDDDACFGNSVSSAGDVNGDGYSDIIVGAPQFNGPGAVFVYYGSPNGLSRQNWFVAAPSGNTYFGSSVSNAGDVNGDGYSDVIVQAQNSVFVFYGSTDGLSGTADWTAVHGKSSLEFCTSVSSAGDVNGDGYADIIIGDRDLDSAFVYYGSTTGLSTAVFSAVGCGQDGSSFGVSVSCAGDVNGDGYSDCIVGARSFSNGQTNEGRAFVYYGNGSGKRGQARQYQSNLTTPIAPGGKSSVDGSIGLGLYARSFLGRQKARMVYEYKQNGQPYAGAPITNSLQYTGIQTTFSDLGGSGKELQEAVSGIAQGHVYKWRARMQYAAATAITGQVFGPWKYMPNDYEHEGGFRQGNMRAPETPALVSPANNAIDLPTNPALNWNTVANVVSFTVQVSTDSNFSALIVDSSGIMECFVDIQRLSVNTLYYWRVRGDNVYGSGYWSTVWSFTTTTISTPALITPANNAIDQPIDPNLVWHSCADVTAYRLQVATDLNFTNIFKDTSSLTDTTLALSGLENNTQYYWRVNASNIGGTSAWSTVFRFTTEPTTHVETAKMPVRFELAPPTPNPFNPATQIRFSVPPGSKATRVRDQSRTIRISVYDISGCMVRRLVDGQVRVGYHTTWFDGRSDNGKALVSGVYLCTMQAEGYTKTTQLLLIK